MGVSATVKAFRHAAAESFGIGMMIDVLQRVRTAAWASNGLKMSVKTRANGSAHALRTQPGTQSGLAALRGFSLLSAEHTSAVVSMA